jgi:hypothetical protein
MKPIINYITLTNQYRQLEFQMCRKSTFKNLIIPNDSCRPFKHKKSGTNYLRNEVSKYHICPEKNLEEIEITTETIKKYYIHRI